MRTIFLFVFFSMLTALLVSCSTPTGPSEDYKDESQQKIYMEGRQALKGGGYGDAIKHFEALDVQYPFGKETENAQLYLIYAYYMKEDYALSVAAADRFVRLHPTNPHVDYAYYMRGLANYYQSLGVIERIFSVNLATRDLTQLQKSYVDFNEVVSRFPNSRYAPPAHQYMVHLRNVMADHHLQIAIYYYDRKAYVAAASRANEVITHYQGAPAVIPALKLLAHSYEKLGLYRQQRDTLRVLQYNHYA